MKDIDSNLNKSLSIYNEYMIKHILKPFIDKIVEDTEYYNDSESNLQNIDDDDEALPLLLHHDGQCVLHT